MAKTNSKKNTKNTSAKKGNQEDFQNKLDELTSEVEKEKDQFLRLFAEFKTIKKEPQKSV